MSNKWIGKKHSDEDEIIKTMAGKEASSMKVIGRGTLVMDAKDIIKSSKYQNLAALADLIIRRK